MADDDNRILRKVFKITEVANLSKEERMAYEASLRHKMEWEGAITYATQEAVRKERERAEKEIEQLKAKAIAEKQKAEQNKIRSVERMLVIIRPGENSTYGNLVDVLDEMAILNVRQYMIGDISGEERELLKRAL